jgi:hypothetical protein
MLETLKLEHQAQLGTVISQHKTQSETLTQQDHKQVA